MNCATWLHKAKEMPKDQFRREVERELTGEDTEPWEIVYFKFYKSQIPVIDRALETAALMLGSDKSRSYCLEMICADFLAGANVTSILGNTSRSLWLSSWDLGQCQSHYRSRERVGYSLKRAFVFMEGLSRWRFC